MQAHGSDRVSQDEAGRITLASRLPKPNWTPRVPKTMTRSEHPGTAVLWEEQYFEVVEAYELPQGGCRYILEPWKDEHIIRLSEPYDAESEALRVADHRARVQRERGRKATNVSAMLMGHLPANVQNALASELGIVPERMTVISTIPPFVAFAGTVFLIVRQIMDQIPLPFPGWLVLFIFYMGLDSLIRFFLTWIHGKPIGSLPGLIAYLVFYAVAPNRSKLVPPFSREKGLATPVATFEPPDDVAMQDAMRVREPLATFLTAAEQRQLADRFGYDYRRLGPTMAITVLICATLGTAGSISQLRPEPELSHVLSGLSSAYLVIEQIVRLATMRKGPAGSILAVVARPFVRKVLA